MDSSILKKAGKYLSERKKRRRYKEMVSILVIAVMFSVIFVLAMPASTLEKEAYCGIEEHVHTDECYERVLVCGYEEDPAASAANQTDSAETETGAEAHRHEESCYTETKTLICGEEEREGHQHSEDCYTVTESKELTCTETESEEHVHEESCYTVTESRELTCGQEEGADAHLHTDECYEISKELTCGQEETPDSDGGASDGTAPAETPEDGTPHVHTEECYELKEICGKEEHTHTQECFDETFSCGMREHGHTDACYDSQGRLTCSLPEHTHIQRCRMPVFCGMEHEHEYGCYIGPEVSDADRKRIINTDSRIDLLPAYEEMEEKLEAFDAAGDLDGYENYFMEISFQAGLAYSYYEDLNGLEDLQKYVVNSEELMTFHMLWEVMALDETESNSIQIYSMNKMGSAHKAVLVYAEEGTVESVTDGDAFTWWTALVAEKEEEDFVVTEIIPPGNDTGDEKQAIALTENKIVIFVQEDRAEKIQEGDCVQADFDYKSLPAGDEPKGYGLVSFAAERAAAVEAKEKPVFNHGLKPISSAETKDIVEINLYDYGTSINNKYKENPNNKTLYPAFQQSAGAPNSEVNLTSVWGSAYNFGDNITADYIDRQQTGFSVAGGGNINGMVKDANGSYASRAMYGENSPMYKELGEDGYPVLANGNSLSYLFSQSDYAVKKNTDGLDGLFQYNRETGEYYYDSRKNHAEFNGENQFLLYDALISPNYIFYPFGNFMPFNKINTESTPASQINREYFENMASYAAYKSDKGTLNEAYTELSGALAKFVSALDTKYNNQTWGGKQVLDLYFDSVKSQNAGRNKSDTWLEESMSKVYNIDYDVQKDFFFGMTLEMNYMQPKGGMTGKNNQYPMVFDFAGDDDVWVYIDGILMMDLSGIHRHAAATMDFVNGTVTYYDFHSYAGEGLGATTTKDAGGYSKTYTFAEILTAAVGEEKAHSLLKYENGKYTTFKDYGTHNFKFYYMERGAGSGVCRINFNFPVIPKNSIAIGKELDLGNDNTALGNPSFEFQVLKEGADGSDLANDLFVEPETTYEIYENGIKTGRTNTVDQNGVIRLKSGEMAIISDIDSSKGNYFVRELLDERIFEQYGVITVDGTVGSGDKLSETEIDGMPFRGVDSLVKNIDDGAVTLFNFVNHVDAAKTGSLSVTKKLAVQTEEWEQSKTFEFEIKLDGIPLPQGTEYTVGGEVRTVETEGRIVLGAEETAVIENILAGSRYTVQETSASAAGFDVSYGAEPEGNGAVVTENGQTYIQGIIHHRGTVSAAVTVVNGKDDYGSLVIEKQIADQKEAYVKGETFSYKVYLENLVSGKLEPYNGPYYLKDADGYYYTSAGKTEVQEISQAEPFGETADGTISNVSPDLRIEITKIPSGSGFYVEELKDSLTPNKYDEPQKDLVDGTFDKAETITDAENTVTADGTIIKDTAAQIVITNKLLSWQIVKRSNSSAELLLEDAEFELVKEGETELSYRGKSGKDGVLTWEDAAGKAVSIYEIEAGTYIMKEVKAPVGYLISKVCWKLVFGAKGAVPEITYVKPEESDAEEPDTEAAWEETEDLAGGTQKTFYFENEVFYQLPNAGGPGIYWYSIGGTLLMAAAALILYKMRYGRLMP